MLSDSFYFTAPVNPRTLHSFPTRRSSDLDREDSGDPGSEAAEDDVQRRTHRGRHVCELHSVRRLDGVHRRAAPDARSEEHTSELQSLTNLVCRLLLEKKNAKNTNHNMT